MRISNNLKAFLLRFGVCFAFLWESCCSYAFIISAFHNSMYQMEVLMYHEPSQCWIFQYFNGDVSLDNTQVLGLYRYKDRIFYLVYNFYERELRFLHHDVSALQDNYKNCSQNQSKAIKLELIKIAANEQGGPYFPSDPTMYAEAIFSGPDSNENDVVVYSPSRIMKYADLKQADHWWDVALPESGDLVLSEFMTTIMHDNNNAYYAKKVSKLEKKLLVMEKDKRVSFLCKGALYQPSLPLEGLEGDQFFLRTARIILENTDQVYNKPEVLYFDCQKNRYASLGPIALPILYPSSMDDVYHNTMGVSYAVKGVPGYWRVSDQEGYPYPSFLNDDRKKNNVLSVENGLILMFANLKQAKAVIHSAIDGHVYEQDIDLNLEGKRSKLLLGDGAQRFIALNNQSIYSSRDAKTWEEWITLPESPGFQDVLWIDNDDER